MGGEKDALEKTDFIRQWVVGSQQDKTNLASYYQDRFETIPPPSIIKLMDSTEAAGAELVAQLTQGDRIELHKLKQAVFFTLMRNDALISQYLKPKRELVKGTGLFNQEKVVWSIENSALNAVLNYGSKSRKVHASDNPTATLKRVYKLLELKYQRDPVFADNVNRQWKAVDSGQHHRP